MREKLQGIVIGITHHTEKLNIITVYSRNRGRLSFLSQRGSGKAAKLKEARILPLAVIETEFNFRPTVELHKLGSVGLLSVWQDLYFHPDKRNLAFFISEFLYKLLQVSAPDANLWDFIFNAISLLDGMKDGIPDFHVVFLASLLSFIGINPDLLDYKPGYFFDFRAGKFYEDPPFHHDFANMLDSEFIFKLLNLNFSHISHTGLDTPSRKKALEFLLKYYEIHFPGTSSLKSLDILQAIYS